MQAVTIQNAPQFLNINDQAMWVLGYNEAVQKMQCTGCAVQQGTHLPMGAVVQIQEPQKFTGDSKMRRAFEIEYGQDWTDPDWRKEVGAWASAWHKATAAAREHAAVQQAVQPEVDMPDVEDMAHSALEEALSGGLSHFVLHKWMRSVMTQTQKALAPTQQGLEQDAARYRWLRNESWACYNLSKKKPEVALVACVRDGCGNIKTVLAEQAMDDAIDAAQAKQGGV